MHVRDVLIMKRCCGRTESVVNVDIDLVDDVHVFACAREACICMLVCTSKEDTWRMRTARSILRAEQSGLQPTSKST